MQPKALASQIEACIPGFRVRVYRRITTGWEYFVLEVNGEYIFRIPKFRGSWARLRKEASLLPSFSRRLPAKVPKYEFFWPGSREYPQRFAGYRKIEGIPCTRGNFRLAWVRPLGEDLGRFLTRLHGLRMTRSQLRTIPRYTAKAWADSQMNFYRRVRRFAYPLLDGETRTRAEAFWNGFLDHFDRLDFEPALIHADLTGGNVIVDPGTARLNGVIDWADVKIADPALDFMGLFETSERLGECALDHYGRDKADIRSRVGRYLATTPFGEIAWGVQQRSDYHTKLGLRHLSQRFLSSTA